MKKINTELTIQYLKDLSDSCREGAPFSLSAEASKRGLDYSATLPTILLRTQMVEPTGKIFNRTRIYKVNFLPESLTSENILKLYEDCKRLITAYSTQRNIRNGKIIPTKTIDAIKSVTKEEIIAKPKSLELYTDKALFAELKRRGYTGNLKIVTDVKL